MQITTQRNTKKLGQQIWMHKIKVLFYALLNCVAPLCILFFCASLLLSLVIPL